MADKLAAYRQADGPVPAQQRLWPLYGVGFENLGRDGRPVDVPVPAYGPDELLVRHDACGICISDVKVTRAGGEHRRLYGRDLRQDPVVLGHEVTLTVVGQAIPNSSSTDPSKRCVWACAPVQEDERGNGAHLHVWHVHLRDERAVNCLVIASATP